MVIADVDLNLLEEQRVNGTVLSRNDLIRDTYDRVIHCADHRGAEMLVSGTAEAATASTGAVERK